MSKYAERIDLELVIKIHMSNMCLLSCSKKNPDL